VHSTLVPDEPPVMPRFKFAMHDVGGVADAGTVLHPVIVVTRDAVKLNAKTVIINMLSSAFTFDLNQTIHHSLATIAYCNF